MRNISRRIRVKRMDIKQGVRMDGSSCPISLAIQRTTKQPRMVSVGLSTAIFLDTPSYQSPLPKRAQTFIERFDAQLPVKPFSFVLPKSVLCE